MKKDLGLNILVGFFAGIVSGFFGAGGGMVLVPFLTSIKKQDEVISRATTIICIFFMAIISSFFYYNKFNIDLNLTFKCVIGGIIGSYIGSKLLIKLNRNVLKILFIIFLVYAGIQMII